MNSEAQSDDESGTASCNLNDSFPCLEDEHDSDTGHNFPSSTLDMDYLRNAENYDREMHHGLEKLAEEIKLFELEENETPAQLPAPVLTEDRVITLQPPGVPFFTTSAYHLYTEKTLVWPFHEKKSSCLVKIDPAEVKTYIKEGFFQREYPSNTTVMLLIKYLFHLMCCTTDSELLHATFNSLCYLVETNPVKFNMCQDLYLAMSNLGGDTGKLGHDVSTMQSPVFSQTSDKPVESEISSGTLIETLMLILQFQSSVLSKGKLYEQGNVADLVSIFLAIGVDPKIVDQGLDSDISTGISYTLDLYSSDQKFYQNMQDLAEKITKYCDFHHHTVSHVCCMYLLPTHRGQTLRSSVAFFEAQIGLGVEEKVLLDIVEVEDVAELVEEQMEVFREGDGYVLHSVMKLLDCCISHEPLSSAQRKHLTKMCDAINPAVVDRRYRVDDLSHTLFRFYATNVLAKWSRRVGLMGRQQTLDELNENKKFGDCIL